MAESRIPAPGELIADKYCVERVLGAGGMGVVVAARHTQLGQRVAIKFMLGDVALDPSAAGRFLREARSAVALTSEHVARVLDVGTLQTGAPYMVMEYLAGVDLAQVLRRDGPLAVADAVGFVLQACEAIAEAHSMGIIHRDLKPANLFVTQRMDGSALIKVLDFGISKAAPGLGEAVGSLTATGVVMGSPGYMSPEQVRSVKDIDARCDIWAIGVILYELLTGILPFAGESLGDALAKIVSEAPPPIGRYRPDLPPGLVAAIHQCLERGRDMRIQSVGELAFKLLPFAPREAAVSVDRIHRMHLLHAGGPRSLLGMADTAPRPAETPGSTNQPWLRSGAPTSRPWRRLPRFFALATVVAVCVASGVAAWYALGAPSTAVHASPPPPPSSDPRAPAAGPVASIPQPKEVLRAATVPSAAGPDASELRESTRPPSRSPQPSLSSKPAPVPRPTANRPSTSKSSGTATSGASDYEHF